ncbi:alpha/beta fold hydrolase [Streptomyces durhamensis]|uniref:alpha/beta fold hydrolase n=1 Tax=Streptomyces durhamensis TaxID=68194 RepID=UPI0004CD21CB|nr:alpha/beta hydrolase [Streptomyces durhamensis]
MSELLPDDGQVIHFEDTGEGPPLLLVHGLGAPSAFFARTVAELSRDHRVITVDLRGHGATPQGAEPLTVDRCAADLHALTEKLDVQGLTLLGWSLGATVAYRYLDRYGTARVRGLVSVEQSPYLLTEEGWEHAAFGALDAAGATEADRMLGAADRGVTAALVASFFAEGSTPPRELTDELTDAATRCASEAKRQLWQDVLRQDWRGRLPSLGLPVLFLHGARSRIYPSAVGHWLADAVPGSRLEVFEHSGHLPFLEEPEHFHRVIRAWVRR